MGKYCLNSVPNKWELIYIIENANWSTDWDGWQITRELNRKNLLRAKTDTMACGYKNKIIHLGSIPVSSEIKNINRDNKIVQTIFHIGDKHWPQIKQIKKNLSRISWLHTSCLDTKSKLMSAGVPESKIKVIPLGIDLEIFQPASHNARQIIREKLNLPKNKIIIGSFQKDGNGWAEGREPKLIKGPDIFCDVVIELSKKYPIHVLLTGPARGYVKKRLAMAGVTFAHQYLKNYNDLVPYWQALDLYLITSRVEGGPKALLEAWATGVPIISTKVGMVPDIAVDNETAILVEVGDIQALIAGAEKIITNQEFGQRLAAAGLDEIEKYSWIKIAERYYQEVYQPLDI